MTDHEPRTTTHDLWDDLSAVLAGLGRTLARLLAEGNRRQFTVHDGHGGVLLRLPLTVVALLGLLLLWRALPLLLLLGVLALVLRGRWSLVDRA